MNVVFASAKDGAATTSMLAVAATWPALRTVVCVELDPAGGDVAIRFGQPAEPGLVSLAAAARRGASACSLLEHAAALPGGLRVVVGPPSSDQATAALRAMGDRLADVMQRQPDVDVLIDVGRLAASSPHDAVLGGAAVTLVVARPTAEEVAHVRARLEGWPSTAGPVGVVLVGDTPYGAQEVSEFLGVEVLGVLAHDPVGAAALAGRPVSPRALALSALMRSAATLAERLAAMGQGTPAIRAERNDARSQASDLDAAATR